MQDLHAPYGAGHACSRIPRTPALVPLAGLAVSGVVSRHLWQALRSEPGSGPG